VAVLLPGKFIFLAHPHTGSSATMLALCDAFPEALDLRPHHMTLADVRGAPGAVRMEQISRARNRLWDHRPHKRKRNPADPIDPDVVRQFITGDEHVWGVVRNPYDFLVTCYVRRGKGKSFESFVRSYNEDPYIRDGKMYYHEADCDTLLRHERLQRGLNVMMKTLGLPDVPLERHNETKNKQPWESYYTPEAYRIVNERFGQEFFKFYLPRTS
jgi:hypothetical protein